MNDVLVHERHGSDGVRKQEEEEEDGLSRLGHERNAENRMKDDDQFLPSLILCIFF